MAAATDAAVTGIVRAGDEAQVQRVDFSAGDEALASFDDPVAAALALAGVDPRDVLYSFKQGGSSIEGISVDGAFTIAADLGGFEIHEPRFEEFVVNTQDGSGEWTETPHVRCTVRVTRNLGGKRLPNTFVGVDEEPRVQARRDGSTAPNPHAAKVAQAKAERNAILRHVPKEESAVKRLAHDAVAAGKVVLTGEASEVDEATSRAIHQAQARRKALRSSPAGELWARSIRANIERTAAEGGLDPAGLVRQFVKFLQQDWPDMKPQDVPSSEKAKYQAWLDEVRGDLGLAPIYVSSAVATDTAPAMPEGSADEPEEQAPEPEQPPTPEPEPTSTPDPEPAPKRNGNGKYAPAAQATLTPSEGGSF